jgi:DNA-binding MarR family transcriptional regulator
MITVARVIGSPEIECRGVPSLDPCGGRDDGLSPFYFVAFSSGNKKGIGFYRIDRYLSIYYCDFMLKKAGREFSALIIEIFRTNGSLLRAGDEITSSVKLSSARWQILGVVDHGPVTVAEIARVMGLARQSVQQTVDALVESGHVRMVDNPTDKRARKVAMRPRGRVALKKIEEKHAVWANKIGEKLASKKLKSALSLLQQVQELLTTTEEES